MKAGAHIPAALTATSGDGAKVSRARSFKGESGAEVASRLVAERDSSPPGVEALSMFPIGGRPAAAFRLLV